MTVFVLDASVALGWLADDPLPVLALRIKQMLAQGDRALVPAFFHLEVANGLGVAERRRVLTAQEAERCITELEIALVSAIETRIDLVAVRQAFQRSRAYGISPYDSVYLHLAQMEGVPLATLDAKLRAAAERAGVAVFR